jgi:hypothetical protein
MCRLPLPNGLPVRLTGIRQSRRHHSHSTGSHLTTGQSPSPSEPTADGISTKWWPESMDGNCICGALLTAKARFSRSLCSPNATRPRRCGCSGNYFDVRASFLRQSSPTNSDPTERRFANLASRDCTSKDCAPTIERKTRISRIDDTNEKCKDSKQPSQLSALFPSMLPFTTRSTCNGICLAVRRSDIFGPQRITLGAMRPLRSHKLRPQRLGFLWPDR